MNILIRRVVSSYAMVLLFDARPSLSVIIRIIIFFLYVSSE
jgi:hypothetical protein